jgi:hypothetical protein
MVDERTGSDVIPDINVLASSDVVKPVTSNADKPFGLEERVPDEQCPHSNKDQ